MRPRFVHRRTGLALLCAACAIVPLGAAVAAGSSPPAPLAAAPSASFRVTPWEALMPKGWDPTKGLRIRGATIRSDSDPRAWALMQEFRAVLDNAPTVQALDGASIRIAGYVVPLETVHGALTEFLLVPYFGACIHTPPPPANQVIFVRMARPAAGFRAMDTVWVNGVLHAARQESYAGTSGYLLDGALMEAYVGEPRR